VIGIIALLISVLLPALSKAREAGARIACASQMRQIGNAFAMYLSEYNGTYPPCWCQDNPNIDGPPAYGQAGRNYTWASLLRKYLGVRNNDPYKGGTSLPVYICPNDTWERPQWIGGGALSYQMPNSPGTDPVFFRQRKTIGFVNPPTANSGAERGIGQIWNITFQYYPLWIKTWMVKPNSMVLLLVERTYGEQAQQTLFAWGYEVKSPAYQLWSRTDNAYPLPILHGRKGRETVAMFNYLFADYHVELLNPADTVKDKSTLLPTWKGGDFMWTIRPYEYKN
jgi:type II secretory pathway pseudopilin PulG